jgi:demethylmenaquinone methyltransferase/2-methoxy-6-polyprenyl-1,4-benzoquinol methylase
MDNREFFNQMAESWDDICCKPEEKIRHVIESTGLSKGDNVLDIGSGTGVLIPYIEDKVGETGRITALDVSENMISISKKKNKYKNLDFEISDYYKYNSDDKYDCIMAYSCYPHFIDKKKFFQKSFDLLRQNGKIIIAHVEGKETINSNHRGVEKKVDSSMLVGIEKLAEFAKKMGFVTFYKEDNEEFYIYSAEVQK